MQSLLSCVVISTVILMAESENLIIPPNYNSIEDYYSTINCIVKLTKKFIHCGAFLTLVDTTHRIDPLIKTLSDSNCYYFLLRPIHNHWRLLPTQVYIIFCSNAAQFTANLNELAKETCWNPTAKFFLTINNLDKDEIIGIFEVLLENNVFDVLLIIGDKNGSSKVYSYFPFDNQKCGQVSDDIIKEEDCCSVETVEKNSKSLEKKFQNCTIAVAAAEDIVHFIFKSNEEFSYLGPKAEGIEQRILKNIAKLENLRIEYILAGPDMRYGVVLPNHTITGVLGYLQNNTATIVGGGFFLILNRVELFDYIIGYSYDNFYLFTPAFREENWKKVYQEFGGTTWLLIVLSFCYTSAVVFLVRKYLLGKKDNILLLLFKMWGYIYGQTADGLFQVKEMRIILLIWILFTYFIFNFYHTAYYSLLTRKNVEKMLKKPNSLRSLPYIPCLVDHIRTFYKITYNETLPGKRRKTCRYSKSALDMVANETKYYAVDLYYSYKIREHRYIDENGKSKILATKYTDDMITTMYTKRGFPLAKKFQKYVTYFFESGILLKHQEEIYHSNKIFHGKRKSKYEKSPLRDYLVEFCILFLGYFISTVCFIIEINKSVV